MFLSWLNAIKVLLKYGKITQKTTKLNTNKKIIKKVSQLSLFFEQSKVNVNEFHWDTH